MELFVLGVIVGGVAGARGRKIIKVAAKGGMALSDAAKCLASKAGEKIKNPALQAETAPAES